MIKLRDASTLALTKFHGRKVRTIVSVIVSGILFALLAGALVVTTGANQSINKFNNAGLGSRYIVEATTDANNPAELYFSKQIMKSAIKIHKQIVAKKKATAKKLGIPFIPQDYLKPVSYYTDEQGNKHGSLVIGSPATKQAIIKYRQAHAFKYPHESDLKKAAAPYNPINFFDVNFLSPKNGQLQVMKNGQEDFDQSNSGPQSDPVFKGNGPYIMDHSLIAPFLFKSQPKSNTGAPLVMSYSDAEELLGFEPLKMNAPAKTVLAQVKRLNKKAEGYSFSACYRNSVSQQQINQAVSQMSMSQKELKQQPIIYGLPPASSCAQAVVKQDNRTAAQKDFDKRQRQFNKEFGQVVNPAQQKINFYIAGLVPDTNHNGPVNTADAILQNLLGSSLGGMLAIPKNLYQQSASKNVISKVLTEPDSPLFGDFTGGYVEFANANDARNFIKNETCTTRYTGKCATKKHPFQLNAFGSNSLGLQDLRAKVSKVFKLAFLVIIVLAAIIMSAVVGRTITDSRRETAIFRAIGAKRSDISAVYLIYTICLSIFIAVFAIALGLIAAYVFDQMYHQTVTVQAELDYGAATKGLVFHLFGWTNYIWLVALACLVSGLLSIIWPLARNIRRNPINDLRSE